MMQVAYEWAVAVNPLVQCLIGAAVAVGLLADHGGTRRIGLVIAVITLFFIIAPMSPAWPHQRMVWLTVANLAAAIPLLVHPRTVRQQIIAATYLGLGAMHCIFSWAGAGDPLAVTANWLVSRAVDTVQASLLLWWSWPNARERLSRIYHKGAAGLLHSRVSKVSDTPTVRAPSRW